jgi:hypothetical protein
MYFFTVLRLIPNFLAICRWVNPFFLSTNISKTVSFFSMRHLAYAEINNHTIPFYLSNSTSKVAHFQTTIFGSIYHDRGNLPVADW